MDPLQAHITQAEESQVQPTSLMMAAFHSAAPEWPHALNERTDAAERDAAKSTCVTALMPQRFK